MSKRSNIEIYAYHIFKDSKENQYFPLERERLAILELGPTAMVQHQSKTTQKRLTLPV